MCACALRAGCRHPNESTKCRNKSSRCIRVWAQLSRYSPCFYELGILLEELWLQVFLAEIL